MNTTLIILGAVTLVCIFIEAVTYDRDGPTAFESLYMQAERLLRLKRFYVIYAGWQRSPALTYREAAKSAEKFEGAVVHVRTKWVLRDHRVLPLRRVGE